MSISIPSSDSAPRRPLRAAQADLTRARIEGALTEILAEADDISGVTFKSVAERAGVTQMTVYRHYPTRDDLLHAVWRQMNQAMGPGLKVPSSVDDLLGQHPALFAGFDRIPAQIMASLTTPQGREMRAALNDERRQAFRAIVAEVAPNLPEDRADGAAAVLQLLHSAHAWASLREQWGFSGETAGAATRWAIEILLDSLRSKP